MSESLHQRSLLTCILTRREFEGSCFCGISCFAFPDLDDRSLAFPLSTCAKVGWGVGGGFQKVCLCGQRMLKMCRNGEGWIIVGRRGRGGEFGICRSLWTSELQVSQTGLRMPPLAPRSFSAAHSEWPSLSRHLRRSYGRQRSVAPGQTSWQRTQR